VAAAHRPTLAERIETYLRAKDENRPYLMRHAFADTATLQLTAPTGSIAFPASSDGIGAITDVLDADGADLAFAWSEGLPYPWCAPSRLVAHVLPPATLGESVAAALRTARLGDQVH